MTSMPDAPMVLESHYRDYLRHGRRARQAERAMKVALHQGDRDAAEAHLGRRWRALKQMRQSLELSWSGLEVFARRELSARGIQEHDAALRQLHRVLRAEPPRLSSHRLEVAGLYGFVRRTLRSSEETCQTGRLR